MEEIVTMGAWFAGGCCGTTPAHIQAMVEKCKEITPVPIAPKNYTFVTSYSTAVELGGRPVIIGEQKDKLLGLSGIRRLIGFILMNIIHLKKYTVMQRL